MRIASLMLCLLTLCAYSQGQIRLDTSYSEAAYNPQAEFSHLSLASFPISGCRYVQVNKVKTEIAIYQLDHQLERSFPFVDSMFEGGLYDVHFVSQGLFHESGQIEYLLSGEDSLGQGRTLVLDEFGEVWLDEPAILPAQPYDQGPIYNLIEGSRLMLEYQDGTVALFALPGHWPEGNCLGKGDPVNIVPGSKVTTFKQDTFYLEGRRYYYRRDTLVVNEAELAELSGKARPAADIDRIEADDLQAGMLIRLPNLQFERGSSDFVKGSEKEMKKLLNLLESKPDMTIRLEGHTDQRIDAFHSIDNNMQLSMRRVAKVKNWLVKKGISNSRMSTKGFGGKRPVAGNDREETRKLNRRVEVYIISVN